MFRDGDGDSMNASMSYAEVIADKMLESSFDGVEPSSPMSEALFPFQEKIVRWCLSRGRAAIFADCGLGKTIMQLEWARHVPGDVLILTPLAVAHQTAAEARKFGIDAEVSRDGTLRGKITITNYEQLHKFDDCDIGAVVLDESSILKNFTGKTRNAIIERFADTPFKLACTATPAPNDHMELGNHSEFLGAMSRVEMLSMFFVHDGGDTSKWRIKGHAKGDFWRWCATWAVMIRKPSDAGAFSDDGFALPPLNIHRHAVESDYRADGVLFPEAATLGEQRAARKASRDARVAGVADLIAQHGGTWLVWCEINAEGEALARAIDGAVEVAGRHSDEEKASRMMAFASGDAGVLVTKPKIGGFGMNWQHCHQIAFVGLSNSYEQFYQAVRRCWRFGQTSPVDVHIFTSPPELAVIRNIQRKQGQVDEMASEMVEHMGAMSATGALTATGDAYEESDASGDGWALMRGDCVLRLKDIADASIGYTVFSPPFASLYTWSASAHDMGNCATHDDFFGQFDHLIGELMRVTAPGRLVSFHCMNLPTTKTRDGFIGISDFRGRLIRAFERHGWIYHSEVTIWKDPVTAMQRTKALGLLYKQLKKDSTMSRQGIPDYLVTMRHPGVNESPVTKTEEDFPCAMWQRYASPVWMDIKASRTLQHRSAREANDEKHICPLQLDVIERAIRLWSNEGDTVLSPFAGIGSEGVVALEMGRRFVGVELKGSYYRQAVNNLEAARSTQIDMFGADLGAGIESGEDVPTCNIGPDQDMDGVLL